MPHPLNTPLATVEETWGLNPQMLLSFFPQWNTLVKNQEVNCAIFSKNWPFLQSKSVNSVSKLLQLLGTFYRASALDATGDFRSQAPGTIAPKWKLLTTPSLLSVFCASRIVAHGVHRSLRAALCRQLNSTHPVT